MCACGYILDNPIDSHTGFSVAPHAIYTCIFLSCCSFLFNLAFVSQLQISKGYTDSPDLRVTWLENLANYHRLKENYFEAAQCRVHISAMISE